MQRHCAGTERAAALQHKIVGKALRVGEFGAACADLLDRCGKIAAAAEMPGTAVGVVVKRRILAEKLDIISEITERTLARLNALPAKDYFGLLIKMAEKKLRAEEGTISLGEADLKRIPADFEQSLKAAAEKVGGTVTLSHTPVDIEDGFILTYGLISENCSFRAIIEAEKDGIRDTAAQALFGAGD